MAVPRVKSHYVLVRETLRAGCPTISQEIFSSDRETDVVAYRDGLLDAGCLPPVGADYRFVVVMIGRRECSVRWRRSPRAPIGQVPPGGGEGGAS